MPSTRGPFNVLLSSAGRRMALLGIWRKVLAELGLPGSVFAADMSRLSAAFHAADRSFLVPSCTSEEFVPAMLDICKQNAISLIIPTIDTELPVYAANRDRFAETGTVVAVSSPQVVEIGNDKDLTHSWSIANGIPTVKQVPAQEALSHPDEWTFPFLVKPRRGNSSLGVAVVRSKAEAEAATRGGKFIAQTIAPGVEHTVDFLADKAGRLVCAIPRRRLETRGGEVSKGMTCRSMALGALAERICQALPGPYGTLNFQVFLDEKSGEINVIEINARFGGGFPLAWEAGGDFPRWMIEEILGLPSTATVDRWRDRLVMLRWDDAVFLDASQAGIP